MKYFKVHSVLPKKEKWEKIEVESSLSHRLPYLQIIGIPPKVANFQRERVISALDQIGIALPRRKLTINFPNSIEILDWTQADLAVAVCILGLMGRIHPNCAEFFFLGALSLDGRVGGDANYGTIYLKKEEGTLVSPHFFSENDPRNVDRWVHLAHLGKALSLPSLPVHEVSPQERWDSALLESISDWRSAQLSPLLERLVQILTLGNFSCLVLEESKKSQWGLRIYFGMRALMRVLDLESVKREVNFYQQHSIERKNLAHFTSARKENENLIQLLSLPHCECASAPCVCERREKKNWEQKLLRMRSIFPLALMGQMLERSQMKETAISFEDSLAVAKVAKGHKNERISKPKATNGCAKKLSQRAHLWLKVQKTSPQLEIILKIAEIISDLGQKEEMEEEDLMEAFFYASELCWGNNLSAKGNSTAVPKIFSALPVSDSSARTTRLSI